MTEEVPQQMQQPKSSIHQHEVGHSASVGSGPAAVKDNLPENLCLVGDMGDKAVRH
ncbi:hypothetical protein ACRRTK_017067 [Alexandromys fortis]